MKIRFYLILCAFFIIQWLQAQENIIKVISEKEEFIATINSKTISTLPGNIIIASLSSGKNYLQLAFNNKGMHNLNTVVNCPDDSYWHQFVYDVVLSDKGQCNLSLVSDIKTEKEPIPDTVQAEEHSPNEFKNLSRESRYSRGLADWDFYKDILNRNSDTVGKTVTSVISGDVASNESTSKKTFATVNSPCLPLEDDDFDKILKSIDESVPKDYTFITVTSIFLNVCLTTSQILKVLYLLEVEKHRLDFAKFALKRAPDRGNYFILNKAFLSKESVKQLLDFVKDDG